MAICDRSTTDPILLLLVEVNIKDAVSLCAKHLVVIVLQLLETSQPAGTLERFDTLLKV